MTTPRKPLTEGKMCAAVSRIKTLAIKNIEEAAELLQAIEDFNSTTGDKRPAFGRVQDEAADCLATTCLILGAFPNQQAAMHALNLHTEKMKRRFHFDDAAMIVCRRTFGLPAAWGMLSHAAYNAVLRLRSTSEAPQPEQACVTTSE